MPLLAVLAVGEAGMYAIPTGFAIFVDGQEPDLEILTVLVFLHDALYAFPLG